MEKELFTKLLLELAFCSIVCDNIIDEKELKKLKEIEKNDEYFKNVDLSNQFNKLKKDFEVFGISMINNHLNNIHSFSLDLTQKFIIIEVCLALIRADGKLENDEIDFMNKLIIHLQINLLIHTYIAHADETFRRSTPAPLIRYEPIHAYESNK